MRYMPPVTQNLLIINVLFFLGRYVASLYGIDLDDVLGLHFVLASHFHLYQVFTYMFMHASWAHIFFNMFAVWMFGVAIENVDILGGAVDVVEEVATHERVVTLGMALGQSYILIHIECDDVLEADFASLVGFYKAAIHTLGRRTRRQSQHKRFLRCRGSGVDTFNDMIGSPLRQLRIVGFDN